MHKIYVVGLGGSGGKTLQFLMDQLSTELRVRGWDREKLPRCWQFVHVDVPAQPDGVGDGLPPTVRQQGGRYLAVTTPNDRYQQLDAGLEQALAQPSVNQLRQLVGWRPDASKVTTPIVLGAGQYRAVGRLATLARTREIYEGLRESAQQLNSSGANQDFAELLRVMGQRPAAPQGTMVLVVSSLAGGTGASMTLDVCNLLRGVQQSLPDFPGGESIAYLYTPDVFGKLDESARSGVNANALGTIAELMSARAAAQKRWTMQEWNVYRVGQAPSTPGRGPKAVFPVGATNGISGALFGDGRSITIYRGFSRALAAMLLSEAQQTQIMSYVVANFGNTDALPDNSELAWAPAGGRDALGFGAIGFASIGLGRDRYAEYVSQRLARQAVERLLRAHHDVSVKQNQRTEMEARDQYAADGYPILLEWAGLPPAPPRDELAALRGWVNDVWPEPQQAVLVDDVLGRLMTESAPPGVRQKSARFAQQLGAGIPRYYRQLSVDADGFTRQAAAARWVQAIQGRIEAAILRSASRWGLPVTRKIVERLEAELKLWAGWLRARSLPASTADQVTNDVLTPFYATDGTIDSGHALLTEARAALRSRFADLVRRTGAGVVSDLVDGLTTDVIRPLAAGLADVERALVAAEDARAVEASTSSVRTTVVQAWPQGDLVPSRFATATNEVLLEDIESYPDRFRAHLHDTFVTAVMPSGQRPTSEESQQFAIEQVITFLDIDPSGRRATTAVEHLTAYGEDGYTPVKMGRQGNWWPRLLASAAPAQVGRYEPLLAAEALLDGARAWVARPGQPLQGFIRQGLQSYLAALGQGAHDRDRMETDFAARFQTALQLAAPLVGVHPSMVQAVHGESVKVSYQFSAAPLRAAPSALRQITQAIESNSSIAAGPTLERLGQAMSAEEANVDLPAIDIVGTYAHPYSPLVFTSLQGPIQQQWARAISVQQRMAFWRWRRGRPLSEFVPVSPAWAQAFITGWLVGRFTGEIHTPRADDIDQRIRVFDDGGWVSFPESLLGVQQINRDLVGWGIPAAVLESLALAIAQCNADAELTALRPYIAVRRLGEELPVPGTARHQALHAWIVNGASRSGELPQILKPDDRIGTVEERLGGATDWLQRLRSSVVSKLLPHDMAGAPGTGPFAEITRHNFARVPREWEIAEQLVAGVDEILEELRRSVYRPDDLPDTPGGIDDVEA
ncbi:MAG: tubulin-like doman-containing protein [Nakamurella sp.]